MSEWHPIESAPRDGTSVRVKNDVMDFWVEAKFGIFHSRYLDFPNNWIITRDPDPFIPMRSGTLVFPTHWMPIPEPPNHGASQSQSQTTEQDQSP